MLYTLIDLLTNCLDLVTHVKEEVIDLSHHKRLDILGVNFSNIAETVLVLFVLSVELALQVTGNQGCEHLLWLVLYLNLTPL